MLDTPAPLDLPPTREAGLARLAAFAARAGRPYQANRNHDLGEEGHPHVSVLSPYIRHRLITEEEALREILSQNSRSDAYKSVSEVFWRTYFKGWMELRPSVWETYRAGLKRALDRLATEEGLRSRWEAACRGETGIEDFDYWAHQIVRDGYMHNHARMWFASIWMFTLELPWELGSDFFIRHLLDGDPGVNTLSWRWVGGMQTKGKAYLARPGNISRYTNGRFGKAEGLATRADALEAPPDPGAGDAPSGEWDVPEGRVGLLVHDEDLSADWILERCEVERSAGMLCVGGRSPLAVSERVRGFAEGAHADAQGRLPSPGGVFESVDEVVRWADGLDAVVAPYAPVGPCAEALDAVEAAGVRVVRAVRPFDAMCWPHARAGFFRFKKEIPAFLDELGM